MISIINLLRNKPNFMIKDKSKKKNNIKQKFNCKRK